MTKILQLGGGVAIECGVVPLCPSIMSESVILVCSLLSHHGTYGSIGLDPPYVHDGSEVHNIGSCRIFWSVYPFLLYPEFK